jgi:hypothetical protein
LNLGCHQYCEQAGGYGGGQAGRPATDFVRIRTTGEVAPVHGALPIQVTCLTPSPCRGAILLDPTLPGDLDLVNVGRSDLDVQGGTTTTIAVPMSPEALHAVRSRDQGHFPVDVIADFGDPKCPGDSELPCTAVQRIVINGASAG